MSLQDGYNSLSKNVNKAHEEHETEEGVISTLTPELTLSMTDEELIDLKRMWLKEWEPYQVEILKKQKENEEYWLGQQFSAGKDHDKGKHPLVDNLIFESLETFLPIATRPKADPLVEADNTQQGNALSDKVRKMLMYLSDKLSYNLKMRQVTRYWALYLLGVMKVGWSVKNNDITCVSVRPQKLILDPKATIEEGEYQGYYIGEYLEDTASNLVSRFPKKAQFIKEEVKEKMGTTVQYIMWVTDEYIFWTFKDEVLAKNKNPHWNYESKQSAPTNEFGSQPMDEQGNPQMVTVPGKNHFNAPKKPYIFLSIFNLGKQPHDETNLISQNLPLQDLVNKRLEQIDKNADNANAGLALSGDSFTEEQAAKAGKAKRNGGVIWVPTGPINSAVQDLPGTPLPNFVYESLMDYRNEIRNIFGTRGSSPQGTINEKTVGGKQIIKGQDSDRIGGGISTYLEQFSDRVFNWFVQLMYVYYDEAHVASVTGKERAKEYISLINSEFGNTKLTVGVKDGSMIPHDPVNQRSEALTLWSEQGIDPIPFFDRLEFPNPRESAKNLFLWMSDPIQLFPELAQQQQKPEGKPPSESINFKDLPPEGQIQLAAKAGIQLTQGVPQVAQEPQVNPLILADQANKHKIEQIKAKGLIDALVNRSKPKPEKSNAVPK